LLGWKPEVPFEEGLFEVTDWIRTRLSDEGNRQ
jgi:nucleoside-diphosphate-sugar epimerase